MALVCLLKWSWAPSVLDPMRWIEAFARFFFAFRAVGFSLISFWAEGRIADTGKVAFTDGTQHHMYSNQQCSSVHYTKAKLSLLAYNSMCHLIRLTAESTERICPTCYFLSSFLVFHFSLIRFVWRIFLLTSYFDVRHSVRCSKHSKSLTSLPMNSNANGQSVVHQIHVENRRHNMNRAIILLLFPFLSLNERFQRNGRNSHDRDGSQTKSGEILMLHDEFKFVEIKLSTCQPYTKHTIERFGVIFERRFCMCKKMAL